MAQTTTIAPSQNSREVRRLRMGVKTRRSAGGRPLVLAKGRAIACCVKYKSADGDAESAAGENANGVSIGATSLSESGPSHLPLWLMRSASAVIS